MEQIKIFTEQQGNFIFVVGMLTGLAIGSFPYHIFKKGRKKNDRNTVTGIDK